MVFPKSRIVAGALALLMLLLMGLALQYMVSAVAEYLVETHINTWAKNEGVPGLPEWQKASKPFELALSLTPNNPRVLQLGGRLYEWRAAIARATDAEAEPSTEKALEYYRQSIKERPLWPYAWMQFTQAKVHAKQFDDEFLHAYEMTFHFGPWEKDVHKVLTKYGFIAYSSLGFKERNTLLVNVKRMANYYGRHGELLKMAHKYNKLAFVCYAVRKHQHIQKTCKKNGINSSLID